MNRPNRPNRPKKTRPPQGTHSIVSAKRVAMRERAARDLLNAVEASVDAPIVAELAVAKNSGDQEAIKRLLPRFLELYGRSRETLRLFRAL